MNKNKFIEVCEKLDWIVYEQEPQRCWPDGMMELRKESPAGEDFSFPISAKEETLVEEIKKYASSFDINEHVALWLPSAGKNGTPNVVELVDDAMEIDRMLQQLAIALQNAEDGVEETFNENTNLTITVELEKQPNGLFNIFISEEGSSGCDYSCYRESIGLVFQRYIDTQSSFMDETDSIQMLKLSVRAFNVLMRNNICTIGTLKGRAKTENAFYGIPGLGKDQALEILYKIHEHGDLMPWELVEGNFLSYWDGGSVITSPCKINLYTKEVFDIQSAPCDGVCVKDFEEVEFNGERHLVYSKDEAEAGDFWYE